MKIIHLCLIAGLLVYFKFFILQTVFNPSMDMIIGLVSLSLFYLLVEYILKRYGYEHKKLWIGWAILILLVTSLIFLI
ncbi:hypothetical protein [Paenibacillus larvae]|uniref:Uncharacterized protein n=1 Tax=Paenibacillus larvae subsp. larvae TaxID=147375 RepID=A0A6C0QL90_9BACL|nr:hypothetical protein [Paenibacillus larvae]QHZ49494.1 hypothetical protein ERICV_00280 [Paenibacillus larvae subsp. larvae]